MRVIRLPRHGASLPIGLGVSCSADRQALGKITRDGVFLEQLEANPAQYLPEIDEDALGGDVVGIDLNRPMAEILARADAASDPHAPVADRPDDRGARSRACQDPRAPRARRADAATISSDHPVYYAGPAKTPGGLRLRLVRADHGRADGRLCRPVPGGGRLAW